MHATPFQPGLSRPSALPWYAAATSLAIGLLPFLATLAVQWSRMHADSRMIWISYTSFAGSLVFRTGVAFLIVQWHGERHGCLAFRRPAAVLGIFALGLLCWLAVQMVATTGLLHLLTAGVPVAIASSLLALLHPLIQALGVWLAWIAAAALMRKDAQPFPPSRVRWRTAGLIAWMPASLQALLLPASLIAITTYTGENYALAAALSAGVIITTIAAAFIGAWLGLPRDLARIHGGRLLVVAIAAFATTALVLGGLLFGIARVFSAAILASALTATGLAVLALAACVGAYYLWTLLLYLGTTRTAQA